jgi:hypothetical protein
MVPQAVVSHLVEASWQDVLQKPSKELNAWQTRRPPRIRGTVLPTECHVRLVHPKDSCITDGCPKYIPREIVQHGVVAVAIRFAERHPLATPNAGWNASKYAGFLLLQGIAELRGDLF